MPTVILAGGACMLALFALATADDPSAGRSAGPATYTAAAVVAISGLYFCLKLAGVGPFDDADAEVAVEGTRAVPAWLALTTAGLSVAFIGAVGALLDRLHRGARRRRGRRAGRAGDAVTDETAEALKVLVAGTGLFGVFVAGLWVITCVLEGKKRRES